MGGTGHPLHRHHPQRVIALPLSSRTADAASPFSLMFLHKTNRVPTLTHCANFPDPAASLAALTASRAG